MRLLAASAALLLSQALAQPPADWLLTAPAAAPPATLAPFASGALTGSTLSNGLLSLTFVTAPFFALWDLATHLDQPAGESLLRALSPEALLTCSGACASSASPFALLANDSVAVGGDCPFVAQGNSSSLLACQASCLAAPACTTVNFGASAPAAPDCVLRSCASPLAPALSPSPGFQVYSTLRASGAALLGGAVASPSLGRSVSTGPYLNRTGLDAPGALAADPTSPFAFLGLAQAPVTAPFAWTPGARGSDASLPWPPPGLHLVASFAGAAGSPWQGVQAAIHYTLFQGLPLVGKWVEVACAGGGPPCNVTLDAVEVLDLALNPGFSPVASAPYPGASEDIPGGGIPVFAGTGRLSAITSLQYGVHARHSNDVVTQGGDAGSTQPRLSVGDDAGLAWEVGGSNSSGGGAAGAAVWTSVQAYLLLHDSGPEQGVAVPLYPSSETYWGCTLGPCAVPGSGTPFEGSFTERRGLALRRFLLAVAPQVAENPLQYHLALSDSASVRAACEQMNSVGWEMLILSYGSGFDWESSDPAYAARVKADVAYCSALGISLGGYDLIGWTRDPGRGWAALDAAGGNTGNACFGSGWEDYFQATVLSFAAATNATAIETDGPYAGYACHNASHAHHSGAGNSVQVQSRNMARMYTAFRNAGMHVNAPDSWFTAGINKMGIGYNEGTSRLPRQKSAPIYRGVIYDATYYTAPSAAWSFLPLTGSGPEDSYEPISANLADFELALAQHLMLGISAFLYQGTTLYDTPQGQALYLKWGAVFRAHRALLSTGDLIHIRRVDGQALDAVLHAHAGRATAGLLVVFNPTDAAIVNGSLAFSAYYTGLAGSAAVAVEPWPGAPPPAPVHLPLDARGRAVLTGLNIAPRSLTWATLAAAAP